MKPQFDILALENAYLFWVHLIMFDYVAVH